MNYVYIIECEDGSYYTGYTTDLKRRWKAHAGGHGAKYTRSRKPVRYVYIEEFENRTDALSREWHIKRLARSEKEELIRMQPIEKDPLIDNNKYRRIIHMIKFVRCQECGKIAVVLQDSACPTKCCGEAMVELNANTTDGAHEKHVPVVTREGNRLSVNVGSVDHPMIDAHYIQFIALETEKGFRIAYLNPGEKPSADFYAEEPVVAVYEYCNLHGLWKTEV